MPRGQLADIKVVELGTYVAGPALGSMLAILGAEVTKVEPLEGDLTRGLTPWSWMNYNWNKESVCIDLKKADGVAIFKRLIRDSDVFIESLSPGATRRLGIDFPSLRKVNPRLLYCSIKGFPSGSSSSHRAAFDTVAQAEGGLMHVTRRGNESPTRVGSPIVDLSAAAFGAVGILANLRRGKRRAVFIEVPLVDVVVYWNSYWFPYIALHGEEPTNLGGTHPGFSPYGVYRTKDGLIFIGVISDGQWEKLVKTLQLERGGNLTKMQDRVERRGEVDKLLEEMTIALTTSELLSRLGEEVPCARINSLTDIYRDRELVERGLLKEISYEGRMLQFAMPPISSTTDRRAGQPRLPSKGQHTTSTMRRLGYGARTVRSFRRAGVIS